MKDSYGVPRDIYAKVKILGVFLMDIVFVSLTGILAFTFGMKVFPLSPTRVASLFSLLALKCYFGRVFIITGQGWQEKLAKHPLIFQTKTETLHQYQSPKRRKPWRLENKQQ